MTAWDVLVEENRRDVLDLLRERPRAVNEIVDALRLSQPTVSKHLRVLREAGFVRVETLAQRRIYALDPTPFAEIEQWLTPYRAMWNSALDALGDRLDDASSPTRPGRRTRRKNR
ncbi:MAG TPA: metalloregulator ArsR/SmtB family transcription factor [Jatrophihabitantaceae bacterium]|nr:metalloregulator ArsR/SmtB family transcription factor [Jatrophihabitantaceae bacterium]